MRYSVLCIVLTFALATRAGAQGMIVKGRGNETNDMTAARVDLLPTPDRNEFLRLPMGCSLAVARLIVEDGPGDCAPIKDTVGATRQIAFRGSHMWPGARGMLLEFWDDQLIFVAIQQTLPDEDVAREVTRQLKERLDTLYPKESFEMLGSQAMIWAHTNHTVLLRNGFNFARTKPMLTVAFGHQKGRL